MPFLSRSRSPEAPAPLPYDPASPEGLAARWVQWVAAAGPLANPVEDEDGRFAAENQPEDVWFLAGSSGRRPMQRSCIVPAGRPMFLPAFTLWEHPAEGPAPVVDRGYGSIHVDGIAQELQEVGTPVPFVVAGARLNGVNGRRRPVPTTVWGLWALVPAPVPGAHEVRIQGGDGYGFEVDVTYRLAVGGAGPIYPTR